MVASATRRCHHGWLMDRLGSRPRLVLLSALMLLVELALIRWVGSNVIYLSYFSTVIFLAVAAVLTMIAQGVAKTFAQFEPLEAYRLDICGSILGIVVFSVLAFLRAPPLAWGVV